MILLIYNFIFYSIFSSDRHNSSNIFITKGLKEYFFILSINFCICSSDIFLELDGRIGLDKYITVGNGVG